MEVIKTKPPNKPVVKTKRKYKKKCKGCRKSFLNLERHQNTNKICSRTDNKCVHCKKNTNKVNPFFEVSLCVECQRSKKKYQMITKSRSKGEYLLTDKDLGQLECILVENPYYKTSPPMTLFLLSDVKKASKKKYKNIKAEQEKREEQKIERANRKQKAADDRYDALASALRAKGLNIRGDSKLCSQFIDGSLSEDWSLEDVVEMCCEMHWLYNYTQYPSWLEDAVEESAEDYMEYKGYSYGCARARAHEEGEPWIREKVFREYGRPDVWPWLE